MKKISFLLAAVMLLTILTACGAKNKETEQNQGSAPTVEATATAAPAGDPPVEEKGKVADIKKAGKIVLGTSADYAPYEFHKIIDGKDEIVGFDIEIAKEIANDLGVKLEIKDMGFDGLIAALNAGGVDFVLAGMTPNDERSKHVDFSKLYYTATQSVLVRTDDLDKYKTMDDLKSASIGVQMSSIQEELVKTQLPDAKTKSLGKITDLIMELKTKKVDAIVMELPVAKGYEKAHKDLSISSIQPADAAEGSAVAVKKGHTDLVEQINLTLDRLIQDNKIEQFVNDAFLLSESE